MTKQESINAFLTEKLLGKCWHDSTTDDFEYQGAMYQYLKCSKCNKDKRDLQVNQDLFTPDGFFLLWNKAQEQEWWNDFLFICRLNHYGVPKGSPESLHFSTINPQTFPILLAEYLGWKEE